MKKFSQMEVAAEEINKYTVRFHLNGRAAQAIYYSLDEVTNYLDSLVEQGGHVDNVQIIQERKVILE